MTYKASCNCGQLSLTYDGSIEKTSICHCFECQKRTGSVFGVQTRLEKAKVSINGQSKEYVRTGDSGGTIRSHFCPECGSTVFWYIDVDGFRDSVCVAIGCFNDPNITAPVFSVYKARKHHWVGLPSTVVDDWD